LVTGEAFFSRRPTGFEHADRSLFFAALRPPDFLSAHPFLAGKKVSWCLPPFMDPVPLERPSMADFEKVVGNIAFAAEEWEDGFP